MRTRYTIVIERDEEAAENTPNVEDLLGDCELRRLEITMIEILDQGDWVISEDSP